MVTITLFDYIQSELIKKGLNEFEDENGNLVFFDEDYQFMTKILKYDEDVETLVNHLFNHQVLDNVDNDKHFKKTFLYRFINRQINRQTIEAFKLELMNVFLTNERFINTVYNDLDKYISQSNSNTSTSKQTNVQNVDGVTEADTNMNQTNSQNTEGNTTADNRDARSELPQDNTNLDINSTVINYANENSISRNRQLNEQQATGETDSNTLSTNTTHQETDGETNSESFTENKMYKLDELFKTNTILENVYNVFDRKCFLQVW